MRRQTSVVTYNAIKANGLLSKLRFDVYDFLFKNGPMTCRELMAGIQKMRGKDFVIAGSSLSTRFSELERFGVIKIIRTRPCKETGRLSLEWDVTQHLPIIPKKKQKQMCLMCNGKGYTDEVIEEQHVKEEQ